MHEHDHRVPLDRRRRRRADVAPLVAHRSHVDGRGAEGAIRHEGVVVVIHRSSALFRADETRLYCSQAYCPLQLPHR